jgi:RNA polymerase sigma-70 factor (ECF subfamily)
MNTVSEPDSGPDGGNADRADNSIPTRASLLGRLKDWGDDRSWQEFFDTYWRLIYSVARKAGLNEPEAQDVVQETVLSVAKTIAQFRSDPARGSFKAWLLQLTRWRIIDQLRKRPPTPTPFGDSGSDTARTASIERVPDSRGVTPEAVWESEWRANLLEVALDRLKRRVKPRQLQIYDLHKVRGWEAKRVAAHLGISAVRVYVTCHRVQALVRAMVRRLEQKQI